VVHPNQPDIGKIMSAGVEVDRAVARAAREARIENKRLGIPLVLWRAGKVVLIPPEEIIIDHENEADPAK
jgi:hypothetical protein